MASATPAIVSPSHDPHVAANTIFARGLFCAAGIAGTIGWFVSGHLVAAPILLCAALATIAAVEDMRTHRIRNPIVLAMVVVIAVSVPLVAVVDHRSPLAVGRDAVLGVLLGGAQLLFVVWAARPALVGGGDWKLLATLGAAVGLVAPLAALLIIIAATPVHGIVAVARRERRTVPLGPGLAAGYLAAITAAVLVPDLVGGFYR
jgi:Flp pilus assembly protein protease CpaA